MMRFVRNNTTIPVPDVYGYHRDDTGTEYLFMSYIPGCTLESVWKSMSSEDRNEVIAQLKHYFDQLRSIPPPDPLLLGTPGSGIVNDTRRHNRQTHSITSEQQFNEFLGSFTFGRSRESTRVILLNLKDDHRIVLTHGDLHPRNIMVEGNKVTGIVDWAYGGWYPEYWEYIKGWNPVGRCQDWWEHLRHVAGDYTFEWLVDYHLDELINNSPSKPQNPAVKN